MAPDDADLMKRWQRGEASAFEALVHRWQEPVARFVARLVGPAGSVQDLCQEIFLRFYLAGSRYRENGAFASWLYQIALNVVRDAVRRRREPLPLPDPEALIEAGLLDSLVEQRELAQVLQQALAELPAPLREVLVLRHYENMGFEQMSRVLAVPASTLKS